jgi:ribosomal protein S14
MGNNDNRMYQTEDKPICSKCGKKQVWQSQYGLCNSCLVEYAFNNLNNPDALINLNGNDSSKNKNNKTKKNNGGK